MKTEQHKIYKIEFVKGKKITTTNFIGTLSDAKKAAKLLKGKLVC
jgi:hypothetical protein